MAVGSGCVCDRVRAQDVQSGTRITKILDSRRRTATFHAHFRGARHLNEPVRIIDCGKAGKIELFTPNQVEVAREESGRNQYVAFLEECHRPPEVARRVIAG